MKSMIANLIDEEILNTKYFSENETDFIHRICLQIAEELGYLKKYATSQFFADICDEIETQVIEVYRMKSYGHISHKSYRSSRLKKISTAV